VLGQPEGYRQCGVQETKQHAGSHCHTDTCPKRHSLIDSQPAGEGSDDHNALDPEIEDTGTLAEEFTDGRKNQRRCDADHGGPEPGGNEDVKQFAHPRTTLNRAKRTANTMNRSDSARSMSAI
jgi:hypothetical protein